MSICCGCMDMWLVFLTHILPTRFSQWESLVSGGGQWVTTCLVVATGWSASQEDGNGPGIYLGDGQTEAPGVPAESRRSDALLWCMLPYLTWHYCPFNWRSMMSHLKLSLLSNYLVLSFKITSSGIFKCNTPCQQCFRMTTYWASWRKMESRLKIEFWFTKCIFCQCLNLQHQHNFWCYTSKFCGKGSKHQKRKMLRYSL